MNQDPQILRFKDSKISQYDPAMPPQTPYSKDLGDREPIAAMRGTADRYRQLLAGWTPAQFERACAPGKWTARQIMIHLAQTELALGNRARMALATPNYAAQAFNQDDWMAIESGRSGGSGGLSGTEALDAFLALVTMNRAFFDGLSAAERATALSHPEYGALTVDWILHQLAGHQIHHLAQVEQIAKPILPS
jgi:DinB superfamily